MAIVVAVGVRIQTQQPTGSTVEYENEQMRLVGGGGEHQKQHNNQPKWR